MTSWHEAHEAATAAVTAQQWNKALRAIAPWLGATMNELDGAGWAAAMAALAAAGKPLGAAAKAVAGEVAAAPDDAAALYRLGLALVEAKRPELAVAILARAVARADAKAGPLAELVTALELQGRSGDAVAVLDGHAAVVSGDPLLSYLRAFGAIMVGDLDGARARRPRLHEAKDERFVFMAARIDRVLARADGLRAEGRLGRDDLRGWHYALTGGVLLRGQRLAKTWDSAAQVKAALRDLAVVIEALGLDVPALLHPPERNAGLVAQAAGALLGRPLQPWYGGDERGLIVVYDARDLIPDLRKALVHHRPGQPLFLRAAEHTTEQPTAPDLLGYLYASNTSPWGPGFTPTMDLIDTSKVPDGELVAAIVDAEEDAGDGHDREALRAFAALVGGLEGEAAPAARRGDGQRDRLWVGSPVAT
jgi:hypothetical protein